MREPKANSGLNSAWKLVGATVVALSGAAAVFVCIPQRHAASDELWMADELPLFSGAELPDGGVMEGADPLPERERINTPTTGEPPVATSEYRHNFMVVKEAKNWKEAGDYCKSLGMELAVVRNAEENSWVFDLMKSSGVSEAWVGLFFSEWDGYQWADASKVTYYTNWAVSHSNTIDECGLMNADGKWNTVTDCALSLPSVCYYFDPPFAVHSGLGGKTWQEANDYCQQTHGSELASVRHAADNDWIYAQMKAMQPPLIGIHSRQAWIGLSDGGSQSDWLWVDGSQTIYTNWMPFYPVRVLAAGRNCVLLNQAEFGRWKDCDCNLRFDLFVCNAH